MTPTLPAESVLPPATPLPAEAWRTVRIDVAMPDSDWALLDVAPENSDDFACAALHWMLGRAIIRERRKAERS